jgi:hypothetical protein
VLLDADYFIADNFQDTIISIQAMAEYASSGNGAPGPGYGVFFRLSSSGNFKHEYSINSATFDFVHRIEVRSHSIIFIFININTRSDSKLVCFVIQKVYAFRFNFSS